VREGKKGTRKSSRESQREKYQEGKKEDGAHVVQGKVEKVSGLYRLRRHMCERGALGGGGTSLFQVGVGASRKLAVSPKERRKKKS